MRLATRMAIWPDDHPSLTFGELEAVEEEEKLIRETGSKDELSHLKNGVAKCWRALYVAWILVKQTRLVHDGAIVTNAGRE